MKKIIIIPIMILLFANVAHAEINPQIQDIALRIAQTTPYDVLRYNCWDYATDLKLELAKYGYKSQIVFGIVNCSSGLFDKQICKQFGGVHAWLEVNKTWIEATTGNIITNKSPYKWGYYATMKYNPYKKAWKERYK